METRSRFVASIPAGLELCGQCGGDGFIPVTWDDHAGMHSCYKCGETGYLPAGTAEREEQAAREAAKAFGDDRPYRYTGFDCGDDWDDGGPELSEVECAQLDALAAKLDALDD